MTGRLDLEMKFKDQQRNHQIKWRKNNISIKESGIQNGREYAHIIPKRIWEENLWIGIRAELTKYLVEKGVQAHSGTHNLLSSWVSCANLYFPIRMDQEFRRLMLGFLQEKIDTRITAIEGVELEFAFEGDLGPAEVLGETGGNRGSGQTSPDVAILVRAKNGKGIVLTESKYTEHSFYRCSARITKNSERRLSNPDPSRCMQPASECDFQSICHQSVWGRKYWDNLELSAHGKKILLRCPAAIGGYQLFRQQSLAEAISKSGEFSLVVSAVAFDGRNQSLIKSNRTSGVENFQREWGGLFEGEALFRTWTHQEWVEYVRQNGEGKVVDEWMSYINKRYEY